MPVDGAGEEIEQGTARGVGLSNRQFWSTRTIGRSRAHRASWPRRRLHAGARKGARFQDRTFENVFGFSMSGN